MILPLFLTEPLECAPTFVDCIVLVAPVAAPEACAPIFFASMMAESVADPVALAPGNVAWIVALSEIPLASEPSPPAMILPAALAEPLECAPTFVDCMVLVAPVAEPDECAPTLVASMTAEIAAVPVALAPSMVDLIIPLLLAEPLECDPMPDDNIVPLLVAEPDEWAPLADDVIVPLFAKHRVTAPGEVASMVPPVA